MLSRNAQGLYWMGRYLEGAQHLCGLLRLQTEALVDRPIREIYAGWKRIYDGIGREPPGGSLALSETDEFTLADSYTLADDLTFERSNPDSVWRCLAMGRENARQMRNSISADMWTSLNLAYLRIQDLAIQDIWTAPESFYAETFAEINTFTGVAAFTMYRDDGWHFLQLGCSMERSQLLASLLLAHLLSEVSAEEVREDDWATLLRAYHATETYNRKHSVEVFGDKVLELLLNDSMLPRSLRCSIDQLSAGLSGLKPGPDPGSNAAVRQAEIRLNNLVDQGLTPQGNRVALLRRVNERCRELHQLVSDSYFSYPLEKQPAG